MSGGRQGPWGILARVERGRGLSGDPADAEASIRRMKRNRGAEEATGRRELTGQMR